MNLIRHVAKIANTDQRCVVAFMQIPGREDHALVIPTDNLPPRFEQAVMDVLKSPDGQQEEDFAVALSRHLLPDTGQNILEALHAQGRLLPVSVYQVVMMPSPNNPVKLNTILENLGRLSDVHARNLSKEYAVDKFNPHLNNQVAASNEHSRAIARGLLIDAEMLEMTAKQKRNEAYNIDSSLRPQPTPVMSIETASEPMPMPIPVKQQRKRKL